LFNEAIVDMKALPGLVRATAINASRAKRSMLSHFQSHYEERFYSLDQIVKNHKEKTTFEDFVTSVFSPAPLTNLFVTDIHSRPSSVMASSSFEAVSDEPLRPRARTDASALGSNTSSSSSKFEAMEAATVSEESANSPKNLKKLTAAIRANINNNVARVNNHRPISSRGPIDEAGLGVASNHSQASPPLSSNSGSKKR
jgi:hypothetical protein